MARSALEPIFQAQADSEHVYVIGLNRVYHRVASVQIVACDVAAQPVWLAAVFESVEFGVPPLQADGNRLREGVVETDHRLVAKQAIRKFGLIAAGCRS